jgi:hypothetical protein
MASEQIQQQLNSDADNNRCAKAIWVIDFTIS